MTNFDTWYCFYLQVTLKTAHARVERQIFWPDFNQWFNDEEKRLLSTGEDDVKVGVMRHELEEERP